MFRVLVVDDEPGALAHIGSIIKVKCPEYTVVGTAGNGKECMEFIKKHPVDLVISDVKMPIMNGIETVTMLKQEYPEIMSVIVSGYQEFEYAQGALKAGASDYILKPIVPSEMQKTLTSISFKLRQKYYFERNNIIRGLCSGQSYEMEQLNHFFSYNQYYGAIIRKNGLPKRFSGSSGLEIYSDIYEMATIYGRDEMEELYLIPKEMLTGECFESYLFGIRAKYKTENEYSTLVYCIEPFLVEQMQKMIAHLYRKLDMTSVVGVSQMIQIERNVAKSDLDMNQNAINAMLCNMDYMIKEQQYDKAAKELRRLFKKWQEEKRPQLWLEYVSRQILYLIANYTKISLTMIECEYMMEDAFYYATSMEELIENLFEIMFKHLKESEENSKVDSPEFFQTITKYVEENLADALTLQSVCKHFAVSQTYLSKLFRKYEQQSFNRYLTDMRIKKALDIMNANKEVFIKDVAAMVGYSDQFYFSRIFRSCVGKCPSDYLEEL